MRSRVAVYNTKPYDREYLSAWEEVEWEFHSFRLEAATAAAAEGADAVCAFVNDEGDAEVLRKLGEAGVRHFALRCAGYNNVDLKAAAEEELIVTRVPGYSPHAVAEHTLALLLALDRRVHRAYNRVREMNFSLGGLVGFDLHGKTAGVIGTGRIGALVAQILRGFGMRVLAHDSDEQPEWAEAYGVEYVEVEALLRESDVVTLHAPLTPETHHLIDAKALEKMREGVYLVNVSRGGVVDTSAVIAGLKSGKLGGVALDVYEEEEGIFFEDLSGEVLQDDELARLLTFPNVLVTAHQAFLTREALREIARVTAENVMRIQRGEEPLPGTVLSA